MKILRTGDIAIGRNYAEMINDAINTNFKGYQRCMVDLLNPDNHKNTGICAWFVYMDGSVHGYPDGWLWKNILSPDGETIREYNVSSNKALLMKRQTSEGYYPYRLCFQLDPNGTNKNNWSKFVGAFRFSKILSEDLDAVEYVKVLDEFKIASKGDCFSSILNTKNDFLIDVASYKVPISKMGFSDFVFQLLSKFEIATSGDLLELGIGVEGDIVVEIRKKLYESFR